MKIYLIKKLKDIYGDFEPSEDDKIVGIVDKNTTPNNIVLLITNYIIKSMIQMIS